ncbi:MAG TPA: hypothetical protein VIG99_19510 [Myxococcaceae bacterium]
MSTSALTRLLSAIAVAASLAGCDQYSTLRGKVSDQQGTQQQGLSDTGGLGGSGTVSAATEVRLMQIGTDGTLSKIQYSDTVKLSASGEYSIRFPGGERILIQALDAQGNVVASGMYENVQPSGLTYVAAPLDTESSVEASVLVQMIRRGSTPAQANSVDVRARINSQVAAAVKASSDPDAKVQALAEAIISAQRTQDESYEQAGLTVDHEALFAAEQSAAANLGVKLDHGDNATETYGLFFSELLAARAAAGISEQQQAKAETCGSSAFRATLAARLQATAATDPVIDASFRQASALEAVASSSAVTAILHAAGAADATVNAATSAAAVLRAAVTASTSATTSAQAWLAYQSSIQGNGTVQGSILGTYMGVNAGTAITADAALTASTLALVTLNSTLGNTFDTALSATGTVNFTSLGSSVVSAYATYEAAVRAQSAALAVFGTKATPAIDVMVVTSGSFTAR